MKGRCSMGQRVLASIVIRLALAEAFCMKCDILALDEPTTNLDRKHINRLGKELAKLIDTRMTKENFQLMVISHDKEFIKSLSDYSEYFFHVSKNQYQFSNIKKCPIEDLK